MLHGGFDLRRCAVCPTRGAEEKGATCAYRLRGGCSAVVSEPVSGLASSWTMAPRRIEDGVEKGGE